MKMIPAILVILATATVQAQEEAPKPALAFGSMPVGRILFLGNSITLHGPAPNIGWTGNWGMAASREDLDYVHLLHSKITTVAGGKPEIMVRNIAEFERGLGTFRIKEQLKKELEFRPDIVVVAIGENASSPETAEARQQFRDSFDNLLAAIEESGHPRIFVRSQFWADAGKDGLMKEVTLARRQTWIDLSGLVDESCYARSERRIDHAGVAGHPGDKGMKVIADALFTAMTEESKKKTQDEANAK
jgi:hypothetical protein